MSGAKAAPPGTYGPGDYGPDSWGGEDAYGLPPPREETTEPAPTYRDDLDLLAWGDRRRLSVDTVHGAALRVRARLSASPAPLTPAAARAYLLGLLTSLPHLRLLQDSRGAFLRAAEDVALSHPKVSDALLALLLVRNGWTVKPPNGGAQ